VNLELNGISFSRPVKEDRKGILALLNSEKNWISEETWKWKYENAPVKPFLTVVKKEGEIIGFGGSIAFGLLADGKEMVALKAEDVIVKRTFRGKGIATELLLRSKNIAEQDNVLLFGFPHKKFAEFESKKLGFENYGKIFNFVKYFPKKFSEKENFEVKKMERFEKEFDDFFLEFEKSKKAIIRKNSEYLNWRFVKKPNNSYRIFCAKKEKKIIGYAVVQKIGFRMLIEEIVALEKNAIPILLNKCLADFPDFTSSMSGHFSEKEFSREIEMLGFIKMPFSPHELVIASVPRTIKQSSLSKAENWFLSKADIET